MADFIRMVAVSDDVYASLHCRFDAGERSVYTGRKDGTNRQVFRRDGEIYDIDEKLVIPLSKVSLLETQSSAGRGVCSGHARFAFQHNNHKREWLYKNHQVSGILCQECNVILKKKDF